MPNYIRPRHDHYCKKCGTPFKADEGLQCTCHPKPHIPETVVFYCAPCTPPSFPLLTWSVLGAWDNFETYWQPTDETKTFCPICSEQGKNLQPVTYKEDATLYQKVMDTNWYNRLFPCIFS